ncbi:MAG: SDR family NAD(P)-dependent oxidoreductase [Actinomycetia bacterium]|nr:SDR family NAD(P)-dependent oxidoreductase [Actinomycetes bacterium]
MTSIDWTLNDVPDLHGQVAVVTGGTRGLGLALTELLRERGATVLTGARNAFGADAALLDLADPVGVERFADWARDRAGDIDLLINNAAISNQPLALTSHGVESQLAVNHLGHVQLTRLLLPAMRDGGRVVTVTSALYPRGSLDLDRLDSAGSPGAAYVRSKLANVLFATELDRRLRESGSTVRSLLAHPGLADTSMHDTYPDEATTQMVRAALADSGRAPRPASVGILYAATTASDTALLYGPGGNLTDPYVEAEELTGPALDSALAAALWQRSAELTGMPAGADALPRTS